MRGFKITFATIIEGKSELDYIYLIKNTFFAACQNAEKIRKERNYDLIIKIEEV